LASTPDTVAVGHRIGLNPGEIVVFVYPIASEVTRKGGVAL